MTKVIVCLGSGGVGKTTVAASLAMKKASEGHSVLVLTLDPSKRLFQALGLKYEKDFSRVTYSSDTQPLKSQSACGKPVMFDASWVQTDKEFEGFVRHVLRNEKDKTFFSNPLYAQLKTQLGSTQEFTSLWALYRFYKSYKYDFIILDTPPSLHALDFLKSSERLKSLFHKVSFSFFLNKKAKFLFYPGLLGLKKIFSLITGKEFIMVLENFFQGLYKIQKDILEVIDNVFELLVSSDTEFVCVVSPEQFNIKEYKNLVNYLKKNKFCLKKIIFNRAYHSFVKENLTLKQSGYKNAIYDLYVGYREDFLFKDRERQKWVSKVAPKAELVSLSFISQKSMPLDMVWRLSQELY